jgi:hypothetical protein
MYVYRNRRYEEEIGTLKCHMYVCMCMINMICMNDVIRDVSRHLKTCNNAACLMCVTIEDYMKYEQHRSNIISQPTSEGIKSENNIMGTSLC